MWSRAAGILMVGATACASGGAIDADAGKQPIDAPITSHPDGTQPTVDGPIQPPPDASMPPSGTHLLLTEIVLQPNAAEFVEIMNPTPTAVNLATYYLSDSGNYFKLPAGGVVESTDFLVKFPASATLAPGAVATISVDTAANFTTAYGVAPTYSIGAGAAQMVAVSIVGIPSLTNAGEPLILFQWDGTADLVKDVDIMLAGVPSAANPLTTKSGVAQDGPDTGTAVSSYATDVRTIAAQPSAPGAMLSTKRIKVELGHETASGSGNGLTGDDETSEDTGVTWDSTGFTAPTPGAIPF